MYNTKVIFGMSIRNRLWSGKLDAGIENSLLAENLPELYTFLNHFYLNVFDFVNAIKLLFCRYF